MCNSTLERRNISVYTQTFIMAHWLKYVCQSAEWETVTQEIWQYFKIWPDLDSQTVKQRTSELWYSDSQSQDGRHTPPSLFTVRNHGDLGTPDSRSSLLNYPVPVLPINEERRQSRATSCSSSHPSTQYRGAETRQRTPELTLKTRRFNIRLQTEKSAYRNCRSSSQYNSILKHFAHTHMSIIMNQNIYQNRI